jgi:hypothetical protein
LAVTGFIILVQKILELQGITSSRYPNHFQLIGSFGCVHYFAYQLSSGPVDAP